MNASLRLRGPGRLLHCLIAAGLVWGAARAPAQVVTVPAAVLQHVEGSAAVAARGEREWMDARALRPIGRGDKLWTDRASRAELRAGAHVLRLDGETHLALDPAPEGSTQLALTQGALAAHVGRMAAGEVLEIGTPQLAVRLRQPGDYRVDVDTKAGTTRVTVITGAATAFGEHGESQELRAGQRATFRDKALARSNTPPFMAADDFDRWTVARIRGEPTAVAAPVAATVKPARAPAPAVAAPPASAPVAVMAAKPSSASVVIATPAMPPDLKAPANVTPAATPVMAQAALPAARQASAPPAAPAQRQAQAAQEAARIERERASRIAQARRAEEQLQHQRKLQAQRAAEERRLQAARAQHERRLALKRAEDERRLHAQRAEQERRLALQRAAQDKRAADEKRIALAKRAAEQKRLADAARRADDERIAQERREQLARLQAQAAREEQAQREAKTRRDEQARRDDQARRAEQARREEQQQAREEQARREEESRREAWEQRRQPQQATQPWRPAPQGVPARRVS